MTQHMTAAGYFCRPGISGKDKAACDFCPFTTFLEVTGQQACTTFLNVRRRRPPPPEAQTGSPDRTCYIYPGVFVREFSCKVQIICPSLPSSGSLGELSTPSPARQQSGRTPGEGAKPPASAFPASAWISPGKSRSGSL